jgi:hypothetical protein
LLARCTNMLSGINETWNTATAVPVRGDSMSLEAVCQSNSSTQWSQFLGARGMTGVYGDANSADALQTIRVRLQALVAVPFRTDVQGAICVAWFEWERNVDELRKAYDQILNLPPSDLRLVQAAIAAEMRLAGPFSRVASKTSPAVERIRRLYANAAKLAPAKADIEFWLSYVQFERDTARNARRAADVQWLANRTLPVELRTAFQERYTVLNMC